MSFGGRIGLCYFAYPDGRSGTEVCDPRLGRQDDIRVKVIALTREHASMLEIQPLCFAGIARDDVVVRGQWHDV